MNNTVFNFTDSREKLIISRDTTSRKVQFQEFEITNKREKNNFKFSFTDNSSVEKLQNIISESINFHEEIIAQLTLPNQIDIKFTEVNKVDQLLKSLIQKENTGSTSTHLHEKNALTNPIIRVSTDLVKPFNQENKELLEKYPLGKNDFLNEFRLSFSKSQGKSLEIITEIVFLHELGHIHLNQKYLDTIFISGLLEKNKKIPIITQLNRNIQESFCDGLASYLTTQRYPQINVLEKYERVRIKTLDEQKNIVIPRYDAIEIFPKLQKLNSDNIVEKILQISVENGLSILRNQLTSSFVRDELRNNLELLLNKKIEVKNKEDFMDILEQELFKYNPIHKNQIKKDFFCKDNILNRIQKMKVISENKSFHP